MRSGNEIAGLVLKAARGAGLPLGACEELSRAALFLAGAERLDSVLTCLRAPQETPVFEDGVFQRGHPLLVAISAADFAQAGQDAQVICELPDGLLDAIGEARRGPLPVGPMDIDDGAWGVLTEFAGKTFVPETDASRLSGAGAGLTDND